MEMQQRFEQFFVRGEPDECWIWTGSKQGHGYGGFKVDGQKRAAYRVAYELYVGPIPEGLEPDHTCHTNDPSCRGGSSCPHRRCVNPAHLELVTHEVNVQRGRSRRRMPGDPCPNGHAFDPSVKLRAGRWYHCPDCDKDRRRRFDARKVAALAAVVVVSASACTPNQGARYLEAWFSGYQAEATAAVAEYEAIKADATAGRPCAQWYDIAIEAGFTPQQWKEPVSRIMYRESHCNPLADNDSSTARGLMQELEMWADDCGGSYEDLHDPVFNINCAVHIYAVSGWRAWSTY